MSDEKSAIQRRADVEGARGAPEGCGVGSGGLSSILVRI